MAKGIEIGVAVDTKAAKQGIESGLIDPLEDAQGALDDLGKSRGPEQLERDLQEAAKATDNLQDETKRTAETIEREYRDAYRKMKVSADDSFDKVKEGTKELKNEAISNFAEVTSSFDGSIQGIADGLQGTLGGVSLGLSTLGPAGVAAGLGLGLVGAAAGTVFSQIGADSEASAQRVEDSFQDMIASGNAFVSEDLINKNLAAIIGDDGKLAKAKSDAKELGVATTDVLRAMAGDQEAISKVIAAGNALRDDEVQKIQEGKDILQDQVTQIEVINGKYDHILGTYTSVNSESQKALEKANLYLQTTDKQAAAEQRHLQIVADKIKSIPTQLTVGITADTSGLDKKLAEYKRAGVTIRADIVDRYGRTLP